MADTLSMTNRAPEIHLTSTQFAAAHIRDGIISGRYAPGEKLWQDRLAKELNVSRIPVREALCTLASEGLVTLLPNRGAVVPELSEEDLEELYALGATLEGMAAKRAVPKLTPEILHHMKALLGEMRDCRDDPDTWYALNRVFHSSLIDACGWPRLVELVHGVRRNLGRYLCITTRTAFEANVREWDRQHLALYRACVNRDAKEAAKIVERHWRWTRGVVQEGLDTLEKP